MKGTVEDVLKMMEAKLKRELVLKIAKDTEMLYINEQRAKMNSVIEQMNRMNCNKRIREKEIRNTSHRYRTREINERVNTNMVYRMMFFNHYGMVDRR